MDDSSSRGPSAARGCAVAAGAGAVVLLLAAGAAVVLVVVAFSSFDLSFGRHPGNGKRSLHLPITVTPATGLTDHGVVRVTSRAFRPGTLVGVTVCLNAAEKDGLDACDTDQGSRYFVGADGALDATYRVPRVIDVGHARSDCGAAGTTCLVVAADADDYNRSGGRPVAFAEGPPPPPTSTGPRPETELLPVTVLPAGPVRIGQALDVTASGFQPGEPVVAAWCTADFPVPGKGARECDPGAEFAALSVVLGDASAARLRADGLGTVHVPMTVPAEVRPFLDPGAASTACAGRPGACVLVVAAGADTKRSGLVPVDVVP